MIIVWDHNCNRNLLWAEIWPHERLPFSAEYRCSIWVARSQLSPTTYFAVRYRFAAVSVLGSDLAGYVFSGFRYFVGKPTGRYLPIVSQTTPPGRHIRVPIIPNSTDNSSAASRSTPSRPRSVTNEISRTPQPASEIGRAATNDHYGYDGGHLHEADADPETLRNTIGGKGCTGSRCQRIAKAL